MRAIELIDAAHIFASVKPLMDKEQDEIIRLLSNLPVYADDDLDNPGVAFVPKRDACFVIAVDAIGKVPWCISPEDDDEESLWLVFDCGEWKAMEAGGSRPRTVPFYSTEQSVLAAIERMKGGAK